MRSFEERDQPCFFGRSHSTEELLLRVLSVRLLLQFAPSGAGKTSLLNAGLFPRLRPHGYLPCAVRLNQPDETVTQATARSLRDAAQRSGLHEPVFPVHPESLWELMSGTQLWTPELLLLTPVLVFDQFEEVFTLRDEAFRTQFAREIGELSRGRQALGAPGPGEAPPELKIIISLREEYLGALEEMSAAIPDLFRERLRVPPLTADEAREAIVVPAALEGDWSSPRFVFEATCLTAFIDFIDGVSERTRVIEPLTLQLVCQRAESIAAARSTGNGPSELTLGDFGGVPGLERLVHDYFRSELDTLGDPATRRRALTLFEHGLLDPAGKRLMLEQDEIARAYGLTPDTLAMLVDSRLLRREPRNESIFYEISHDRLTEVIARNRAYRLPRWVRPAIAVTAVFIVGLVVALWIFNRQRRDAIESRNTAIASQRMTSEALQVLFGDNLADRLREAGLTDALQQVLNRAPAHERDLRANVLQSRRRGELAWERGTLADSERQFTRAVMALDRVPSRDDPAIMAERALALRWLGDIHSEKGHVTEAKSRHAAAVELWKRVLASRNTPEFQLSAAEAGVALGTTLGRTGDWGRAGAEYLEGLRRALDVLWDAYDRVQDGRAADGFDLGRALHVYTDSTLNLARITWYPWELKRARALAVELLRLRPMSAQARIQVGAASAIYGAAALDTDEVALARRLFEESITHFRDVTQSDPSNRRMLRERAAVLALMSETLGRCAIRATCRDKLRPGELVAALTATLDAVSGFEQVATGDDDDRALLADKAWALEIQALLARARRSFDTALQLVDQALDVRRRVVVDAADMENRSAVINALRTRAEVLGEAGKTEEALRTVEDVLRETGQLPEGTSRLSQRFGTLRVQATLLEAARRSAEAKSVAAEADRIGREIGSFSATRDSVSRRFNLDGNALFERAAKLSATEAGPEFDRATAQYRQAVANNPLSPVIWGNLRRSCSSAANVRAAAPGQPAAAAAAKKEAALRCALTSAWMQWVLLGTVDGSDASERNAGLRTLYEARRSLAMFLSEANDKTATTRARALAEHGVQEAEAYFIREQSTDALFLRADASFGAARMRQESDAAGWEPAFRAAIAYGEQLRAREPSNAERHRWVGMARGELANRFDDAGRAMDAAAEREVATLACREALRLSRTEADREGAQSCLNAAR